MADGQLAGIEWVRTSFSIVPRWTVDIDLGALKHEIEGALGTQQFELKFFAQGAFNKLYTVQTDEITYIMRISLPVDLYLKSASEVATTLWMQHNTALPVPKILAHKCDRNNSIGFEWILMTKLPGETLSSLWRFITREAKQAIVRQLAACSSTLFRKQRKGIGNLYETYDSRSGATKANELGKIVSLEFLWGTRSRHNAHRGPFQSSRDWLASRLSLVECECISTIQDSESDEDDRDDAERTLKISRRLLMCLDIVFPKGENLPEQSMLHHDDLSLHNILVDSNGTLTGVVDWECVSWVPLWKACNYPTFLQARPRNSEPNHAEYQCDEKGEPNSLYWIHLKEYELTILRHEFLHAIRHLEPEWMTIHHECRLQADFDYAVSNCENEFLARDIEEWINAVTERKSVFDLQDRGKT